MTTRRLCLPVLLLVAIPAVAGAQRFTGKGQTATDAFVLPAGLVIFEMEYRGEGAFAVTLLDAQGKTVADLANATGVFAGSKAVHIASDGRYLLNVEGTGEWVVRARSPVGAEAHSAQTAAVREAYARGAEQGSEAADGVSTFRWMRNGFLAGLVGGPIGMGISVNKAGKSDVPSAPPVMVPNDIDRTGYLAGFSEGFADRVRARRQRNALIGGIVGTAVLAVVIVQAIDLAGIAGDGGPSPSNPAATVVPLR